MQPYQVDWRLPQGSACSDQDAGISLQRMQEGGWRQAGGDGVGGVKAPKTAFHDLSLHTSLNSAPVHIPPAAEERTLTIAPSLCTVHSVRAWAVGRRGSMGHILGSLLH